MHDRLERVRGRDDDRTQQTIASVSMPSGGCGESNSLASFEGRKRKIIKGEEKELLKGPTMRAGKSRRGSFRCP